jgi:hypothetical protein
VSVYLQTQRGVETDLQAPESVVDYLVIGGGPCPTIFTF